MQRNLSRKPKFNSKARESGNDEPPRRNDGHGGVGRPRKVGVNMPHLIEEPDGGRGKKRRIVAAQNKRSDDEDEDDPDTLAATVLSDELRDALSGNGGYGVSGMQPCVVFLKKQDSPKCTCLGQLLRWCLCSNPEV